MAAVLCMAFSAGATDASLTFADNNYPSGAPVEYIQVDGSVLIQLSKGSVGTFPSYNDTQSGIMLSRSNIMTVTGGNGVSISQIDFTFSADNYAGIAVSGQPDAVTINGTEGVWKGNASNIDFTASKTTYIKTIKVTYTGAGTIAPPQVIDIKAFLAERPDVTTAIESSAVVVYQTPASASTKYLFLKDESGWLYVSGNPYQTYEPGDVVPGGYQGTYSTYGATTGEGTPMLYNTRNFKAATSKVAAIAPLSTTPADIASCPVASLVCVKDVTISPIEDSSNYSCSAGGASVALRNQFSTYISLGAGRTVTGLLMRDEGNYTIYPISVTDADGKEYVRTPALSPAAGEIWAGDKVAITCATTDAAIYYTTDGTEPTTASTLYTEPIVVNSDMTIKAIAIKEGLANSATAECAYTVKFLAANMAMFNFSDPSSLMAAPKYGEPTTAKFADITKTTALGEDVLVSKAVSIADLAGKAQIYVASGKFSFRPGKPAKFEISGNGNKIKTITFTGSKFNNITTTSEGTYVQETGIYTAPEGGIESVIFTTPSSGLTVASLSSIMVECVNDMGGTSAISTVGADDTEAPAEYFNLQGIRVSEPAQGGIYIRKQGNKVEKVIIR